MTRLFFLLLFPCLTFAQTSTEKVFTQDIKNFWIAYDSIQTTSDVEKQISFINTLYIDKASDGLKAFLRNKENVDKKYISLINADKSFWETIRPKMADIENQVPNIKERISYFATLYPELKEAKTYFIIGLRQQGGTTRNNISIIGTEVVAENADTNLSSLIHLVIHEYVHTQQVRPDFQNINVLTSAIREGACDFIAELVTQQEYNADYIDYGKKHEVQVWRVFKNDMLTNANDWWVSTGNNPALPSRDLGYFMGYAICKSFYQKATDKKQAIKQIVELDYANPKAVEDFLKKSGYEDWVVAKGYDASKKLDTEGYVVTKNKIVFQFKLNKKIIVTDSGGDYQVYDPKKFGAINTISVAGDFNDWATNESVYNLRPNKNGQYTLSIDKGSLGKAGDKVKFKFLINNKYGVVPNFATSNRIMDKEGKTHLFVQL